MKTLLLGLILTLTFNSCAQETIKGNGNISTETRTVNANFSALESSGAYEITILDAPQDGKIKLEGESNILEKINVEVQGNTLVIEQKKGFNIHFTKRIKISFNAQNMTSLGLSGSGSIDMKGTNNVQDFSLAISGSGDINAKTKAQNVSVGISGSGNVGLSGTTDNLKIAISGSGDVDAFLLNAQNSKISVSGSGDVQTTVHKNLIINSAGSGDVFYKGNPEKIESKMAGSGDLIDEN